MYCDCVLGESGWQPAYTVVLIISAVFVVSGLAVLINGVRKDKLQDVEAAKHQVFDFED